MAKLNGPRSNSESFRIADEDIAGGRRLHSAEVPLELIINGVPIMRVPGHDSRGTYLLQGSDTRGTRRYAKAHTQQGNRCRRSGSNV